MDDGLRTLIRDYVRQADDPYAAVNEIREVLHEASPARTMPVDLVRWIPIDRVTPNDYNPNAVARIEMGLLLKSIEHDGYTQPVVTIHDSDADRYVIVDGYHRYFVMKANEGVLAATGGHLPCTVIDADINGRMASTVRHNRARGKHSMSGMGNMVYEMLRNGMKDADICNELGLEPEELLKLKHITGYSKLYRDHAYSNAWVSKSQIEVAGQRGVDLTVTSG